RLIDESILITSIRGEEAKAQHYYKNWSDSLCLDGDYQYDDSGYAISEYTSYLKEIEGVSYEYDYQSEIRYDNEQEYRTDDLSTGDWAACDNASEFSDTKYNVTMGLTTYIQSAKMGMALFTYDSAMRAYKMSLPTAGGVTGDFYIKFTDDVLYEMYITQSVTIQQNGEMMSTISTVTMTFDEADFVMPTFVMPE
ncbi:MAG: hypothetical protein IJX18_01625, partial [Clostridia bacterium]|nr:hypothetical protein [Clostridia bacterium]